MMQSVRFIVVRPMECVDITELSTRAANLGLVLITVLLASQSISAPFTQGVLRPENHANEYTSTDQSTARGQVNRGPLRVS